MRNANCENPEVKNKCEMQIDEITKLRIDVK